MSIPHHILHAFLLFGIPQKIPPCRLAIKRALPVPSAYTNTHRCGSGGAVPPREIHPDREMFKANNDNADELGSESASHATLIILLDNILYEYSLVHMNFNITLSVSFFFFFHVCFGRKGIIIINEYDA